MSKKTVSYSQFSLYANCPKRWKLDYLQGLRVYEQNINTCFGSAFHKTLQHFLTVLYNDSVKAAEAIDLSEYLKKALYDEYKESLAKNGNKHYTTPEELTEFYLDGDAILKYLKNHRRTYFSTKQHRLVGIEIALQADLINNVSFLGFIDVAIQSEVDNRIKILDIKTSTQGWNKHQKADMSKIAQLVLYKDFYSRQFNVDPDFIDVEYLIVRRKINESSEFPLKRVQVFSPASGKPTRNKVSKSFLDFIQNCFTTEGEYNQEGSYPAINSSSCKYCPYRNEEILCSKKERIKSKYV